MELLVAALPKQNLDESEENINEESHVVQKELSLEVSIHGKFQGSEIIFSELIEEYYFVSIDTNGFFNVYNFKNSEILFSQKLNFEPICVDVHKLKKHFYFGTKKGCLRVFELTLESLSLVEVMSNRIDNTNCIEMLRIFDTSNIGCLKCGGKNELIIFSLNGESNTLEFYGKFTLESNILQFEWTIRNYTSNLTILLSGGLLMNIPIIFEELTLSDTIHGLNDKINNSFLKKIDFDCERFLYNSTEDLFYIYGSDYIVKKYKAPNESISKVDMKNKIPIPPIDEYVVFDIYPRVGKIYNEFLIFGCEDGELLVFNLNTQEIARHQLVGQWHRGISFMQLLKNQKLIVGGADGSLFVIEGLIQFNTILEVQESSSQEDIIMMPEPVSLFKGTFLSNVWPDDDEVESLNSKLNKSRLKELQIEKELLHKKFKANLQSLRDDYQDLMSQNNQLDENFRLTSEECFIDTDQKEEMKNRILENSSQIRQEAYREIVGYQLAHKKIKEITYNKMDTHTTTITALLDKLIVFNFPITKREPTEARNLKKVSLLRNMDKRERAWVAENPQNDFDDVSYHKDLIDGRNNVNVVNIGMKKPQMVMTDFKKREKAIKEYEEEKRKKNEALQNANNNQGHRKIELVNRRVKKKRGGAFSFNKSNNSSVNPNEANKNAIKIQKSSSLQEMSDCWGLLYSSLELTTQNKKISQIYLIKNVIRNIKEEFNAEFMNVFKIREKKIDFINENLKKINEIYTELQQPNPGFATFHNVLNTFFN
jgi:hypothetical protein